MKKQLLFFVLCFAFLKLNAQEYTISFQASGAGSTVDDVLVQNVTQGTATTLTGTDLLQLSATNTGFNSGNIGRQNNISVYPNPFTNQSTVTFYATESGVAAIELFDVSGRKLFSAKSNLSRGIQSFTMNGVGRGSYVLRVQGETYLLVTKLTNINPAHSAISIRFQDMQSVAKESHTKSATAGEYFQYNEGDLLIITGSSGCYSTIVPLLPTHDTLITFNFVPCIDANGNSYAVVQIGNQLWMAENLNAGKYQTGEAMDLVTDNTAWSGITTAAYCSYNNLEANSDIYGRLYNWYAATDSRNIAPHGWHVPSDAEWHRMILAIDKDATLTEGVAESFFAAGMLKETGTSHWSSPNEGATNEYGFSALPAGARNYDGTYDFIGTYAHWWCTDQKTDENGWLRYIPNDWTDFQRITAGKMFGLSLRCVQDTVVPRGYFTINDTRYNLDDGMLQYFGNFEGAGVFSHEIMLYSSQIGVNWNDSTTNGSGPVIDFEIFNTKSSIESGIYNFSIPEIADSIIFCSGNDINGDGKVDSTDCQTTLVSGTYYISSRISAYGSNIDLNSEDDSAWLLFDSGTVTIQVSGSRYTLTFDCTGVNNDKITGYFEGSLRYFDWSDYNGKKSKEVKRNSYVLKQRH